MRTGVFKAPPRACAIFPQHKRQTHELQFVRSFFVQVIGNAHDVPLLKPVECLFRLAFDFVSLLCDLLCLSVLERCAEIDTEGGICYGTNVMSKSPLSLCRYSTLNDQPITNSNEQTHDGALDARANAVDRKKVTRTVDVGETLCRSSWCTGKKWPNRARRRMGWFGKSQVGACDR